MAKLIDTHQHLVYPDVATCSWTDGIPALANTAFTLADYHDLTANQSIVGSLFMETGVDDDCYQDEVRFIAEQAKNADNNIMGIIASCRPEENAGFDQWLTECNSYGVVGYRRILHVMDDELSRSEVFRSNIRKIGAQDKTFDICFLERQLPIAAELAQACDNTQMILNHCGVPAIADGDINNWKRGIDALAELENVACKVSGIMAYCAPGTANLAQIKPYLDHVLEKFGTDRLVWGSDWPVVNLADGVQTWLEVTQNYLSELSATEAEKIGHLNAIRIYNL